MMAKLLMPLWFSCALAGVSTMLAVALPGMSGPALAQSAWPEEQQHPGALAYRSNGHARAADRGFSREVSEQAHATRRREAGELRPFHELLSRAQSVGRGEYLGVEPNLETSTYRFKFLRSGANVIWVDIDGRTGRVLSAK